MKKLAIIPAFNESESILRVVEDIRQNAPDFDYLIINDCSTDCMKELCINNKLNILNLPVNLGIGGAVQAGYLYAFKNHYDIAVQFDGDGQHEAAYLKDMLKALLDNNADMVIGSRFIENQGFQSTAIRQIGIRYFSGLIYLVTGKRMTDPTSGMRMVNRALIEHFTADYPRDYPEPESMVAVLKLGTKIMEIPVTMRARDGGVSSISPVRAVYYMVKVTLAVLLAGLKRF